MPSKPAGKDAAVTPLVAAPILTGDPQPGIHTYFALGDSVAKTVVQDISDFLTSVEPSEDTDELDATTFRNTSKRILAGFSTIGYTLTGYYSEEAYEFFAPLRKMDGVAYEYGPGGNEVGKTKISGLCTVFSFADPSASVDAVNGLTVELRIETRTVGVFA
jgi:hypothetical protein